VNSSLRGFAVFDAAPELPLGCYNQVLVERIGMELDLNPFAAAGDDRQHRRPGGNHPHVVLQLWRILLNRGFFGK
jgi:hypothetical protein